MWRDPMTITVLTKENCQLVLACSFRDLVNYCHCWKHAAFRKPWYRRKNWEFHIWIQWRKKEQMRYSMACASEASKLAILLHTSSNNATPPNNTTPCEPIGIIFIQTTTYTQITHMCAHTHAHTHTCTRTYE